jgi:hypothetical protein
MIQYDHDHENEIIFFAETNFRNQRRRFGIKTDDRRRHFYCIGKTGTGKTTLLENMIVADIKAGHGVGVVDPHGDLADRLLDFIPSRRINDVVYFNPADTEWPIGFNILETINPEHKHLVASGLMGVFKKIWPDVWSARMEYILNNAILALLDYPGSTLLGVNRLLVDKEFRKRVISKVTDPVVKAFWVNEYTRYHQTFQVEAIAPIQNKVGQFLSASIIRNIVAQVKSTINIREIMDTGKIFIMNLAKGRIGEDNSRLLGGMLVTRLQLAAMERVDTPEEDRRDFYLYVDEFQNFATPAFANILSEARKYRLNLILAHQYIDQLDKDYVRPAIFGNVGTIVCFRVGAADAEFLANEFAPDFTANDLVNLAKYDIYLKLMIDGVASKPFSATTLPPLKNKEGNREKIIRVSREHYAKPRALIEDKILRWSGIEEKEETTEEAAKLNSSKTQTKATETKPTSSTKTVVSLPAKQFLLKPKLQSLSDKNLIRKGEPVIHFAATEKPISLQEALSRKPIKIKTGPQSQKINPSLTSHPPSKKENENPENETTKELTNLKVSESEQIQTQQNTNLRTLKPGEIVKFDEEN